ncbi:c-type cytochrome [Pelagibacterium montanilacus]|uniref:c-type cytochrome n=1 Tax=Pelagibacterium montanilacus TaxID=2185280 RepID=UPI000F8CDCE1|nr:cytochrome c [Pelagibacterium montanilacus]
MRKLVIAGVSVLAIAIAGAGALVLLSPSAPERDLTLTADAGHGDYLIRLGGCVACHTDVARQGAYLAGGAPIESPYGRFVAPNITSDPQYGIGDWTLAEFSRAMTRGERPEGGHYYPALPYEFYASLTDQDVVDLYAALTNVPPVAQASGENDLGFPFSMRFGLGAWKAAFFSPETFVADPGRSEAWNRGAYIVNGPAHCGACHSPRSVVGAVDPSGPLSGGIGPDITPQALAQMGYDREWMIEVLMGGVTPGFDVPGGDMALVISESTVHWTETDLDAVAAYLLDED